VSLINTNGGSQDPIALQQKKRVFVAPGSCHARFVCSRLGKGSEGKWCLTGRGRLVLGADRREGGHRISITASGARDLAAVKDTAAISSRLRLLVGLPPRPSVLVTTPSYSALAWPPHARELDGIPPVAIPTSAPASNPATTPWFRGWLVASIC
jgi:hypothetical protein